MSLLRSLSALSVYIAGRGEKQAVALHRDSFSQAPFSFPCFPFPRSTGFLSLTCCSFLYCAWEVCRWGRKANTGNLFRCNNHRIPCLTPSAPLSFSIAYEEKTCPGGKAANFQASFLIGKLLKTKQNVDSSWCWL